MTPLNITKRETDGRGDRQSFKIEKFCFLKLNQPGYETCTHARKDKVMCSTQGWTAIYSIS